MPSPMRALLVAMNCQKGDVALNLARHLDHLKDAAEADYHIAVFPEMSLTGYLNPESQRGDIGR